MIRIAFFSPLLDVGGTQRHLQLVLRLLDRRRFTPEVVTLRPGGAVETELRRDGVPVRSLDIGQSLVTPRAVRALMAEARRLRTGGVDVVQGYQWRPSLVGALAGRLAGVPLVLAGKRSLSGADRQARLAWRCIGRTVDTIVTNADALRAEAEVQGVVARWEILQNGVDVDRFRDLPAAADARATLGLDPGVPVVGAVGRLEERKGHRELVGAVAALVARGTPVQLLLVGDGPLRDALAREAAARGLERRVRFAGSLPDVRGALAAMDVFALPSHEEGMSNALLEAMAAARAIVATDVGGTPQVLGRDGVGLLVPPRDEAALAEALAGLVGVPERAAALGAAARRRVEERFDLGAMMDRLQTLWVERLAAHGRRLAA